MVCLDEDGAVVRPALLWNDTRSAGAARELVDELGGPEEGGRAWAEAVGVVPVASFTVTKLRWLAHHEPEHARRTAAVCLPHDWLTWKLSGSSDLGDLSTDRSDASGTGYWSAATGEYRPDLLERAFGSVPHLPRVVAPGAAAATMPGGAVIGAGAGDNAASALGLGAEEGDVVVSIGTSGVVTAVTEHADAGPDRDRRGLRGRHRPVPSAGRDPERRPGARRSRPAAGRRPRRAGHAGAGGAVRFGRPGAGAVPRGGADPQPARGDRCPARADARHRRPVRRWRGQRSRASSAGWPTAWTPSSRPGSDPTVRSWWAARPRRRPCALVAAEVLGLPVDVPPPGEYVADGAARQAAWALAGSATPPVWDRAGTRRYEAAPVPQVRARYAEARELHLDPAGAEFRHLGAEPLDVTTLT